MDIRGLTKFSLIDFPGKITCILYVGGCNFRCPYCHNPHLVIDPESQPRLSDSFIFNFLEKRRGKIEGVVISGGEPSMYSALTGFTERIKSLGYFIKLDTNGSNPEVIISIHKNKCLDALGLDYKSIAADYMNLTKSCLEDIADRVQRTILYAIENKIILDVRTTVHKKFHSPEILGRMREELNSLGVTAWTLQQFHAAEVIDDNLSSEPTYSDAELIELARGMGNHTRVRGLKGSFIFDA
ncbi:MAG TPA: anaerobic ribonucleoside-triphosphate reductase activating protein [Lentisphaeria bacterium]|nr:MAG: anaerobic ribonucleoside-triphosphate reductase activating protein [Lentisphaerae bacterium GWF2_49_21]HBC88049.1 anaerobic ribonucleoside-triphosphate reductase activating protein [Lentisphaeria bacterium]